MILHQCTEKARTMTQEQLTAQLLDHGCLLETKEDHQGTTKHGWWQDTVFLGTDTHVALQALLG